MSKNFTLDKRSKHFFNGINVTTQHLFGRKNAKTMLKVGRKMCKYYRSGRIAPKSVCFCQNITER